MTEPVRGQSGGAAPVWGGWQEIPRVIFYPPFLRKTVSIALVVGTVLFAINHLDEVLAGQAGRAVWVKTAATYFVPFVVSNLGLLVGSRRREPLVHDERVKNPVRG